MTIKDKYGFSFYKKPIFIDNGKSISYIDETVIQSGTGPQDYRAFGDMHIDANGFLHITWRAGSDHLQTFDSTLFYCKSLDQEGKLWGTPVVIANDTGSLHIGGNTIFITPTGRIIIYYGNNLGVNPVKFVYSDDGGTTFSSEQNFTNDYPTPTGVLSSPGRPIYKNGLILKAAYGYPSGGNYGGYLYQSSDDGLTYTQRSVIAPTNITIGGVNAAFEEPTLFARHDKLLISLLRSDPLHQTYMVCSPDNGITWSYPTAVYPGVGKGSVDISPSGTIFVMTRDYATQRPIKCISTDGGKTFTSSFIDDRTGAQMYGGVCWSPIKKMFIVFYMVTVGDVNYGSCDMVVRRFSEN